MWTTFEIPYLKTFLHWFVKYFLNRTFLWCGVKIDFKSPISPFINTSEATKWSSDRAEIGKCINVTNRRIRVFYKILLSVLTGKKSGRRWNIRDLPSQSVERQQYLFLSVNIQSIAWSGFNWTKRRKVSAFLKKQIQVEKHSFSAILVLLIMQTR